MKRKCRKCGQWIRLLPVAMDLDTGVEVARWCSPTIPMAVCSLADQSTGSRHVPELVT